MKASLLLFGAALLCLLQTGCVHAAKKGVPLSPSELNTSPSHYNGKTVIVRGYVTLVPEGHTLYESKALNAEFRRRMKTDSKNFNPFAFTWKRYCLTIANPGKLYKHQANINGRTLIFKGKLIDNYLTKRTIDLGACPLPTAIVVDYSDLKKRYPELFH